MHEIESTSTAFESNGFAILSSLVSHAECDHLIDAIAANPVRGAGSRSLFGIELEKLRFIDQGTAPRLSS
jgi:hypothetical protein